MTGSHLESVDIGDIRVDAVNMEIALDVVERWIAESTPNYVCFRDAHGVVASGKDSSLRDAHRKAGMVVPDGMPLVWFSRLMGHRHVGRVYGPDLMLAFCERSAVRQYRHFLYGGLPGVPERLADTLRQRFPGIRIVGCYSPPFRPLTEAEDVEITEMINAAHPHIVWVGIGTPKQEKWMAAHVGRLNSAVLLGVGAAFDFLTGCKPQAPIWMQRRGLEWIFRVVTEPKRLWRRYAVTVPSFTFIVLRGVLASRRRNHGR